MIIASAPYRLPLGGGGSDLPWFAEREGGYLVTAALNLRVHVAVHAPVLPGEEEAGSRRTIEDLAQQAVGVRHRLQVTALGDIPGGTGLGSSGAYIVALLRALLAFDRQTLPPEDIAEAAVRVESIQSDEVTGKQDPYASTLGGVRELHIAPSGHVRHRLLRLPMSLRAELEERLLLVYTGWTRSAADVLTEQRDAARRDPEAELEGMRRIKEIGLEISESLEHGRLDDIGPLFDSHWQLKRARAGATWPELDEMYAAARRAGASGGKLVGAGGGGFLLLDCPGASASSVRRMFRSVVPVRFADTGVRVDHVG